jgi:putative ABC transport system permease protein
LLSIPAVSAAVRIDDRTFTGIEYLISGGVSWPGKDDNFNPSYVSFSSDASILKVLGLKIVSGRWFFLDDPLRDTNNVVLNQSAVKKFNLGKDVVGMRFQNGNVIGVVEDFAISGIKSEVPAVVFNVDGPRTGGILVQFDGQFTSAIMQKINTEFYNVFSKENIFNVSFVKDEYNAVFKKELRMSALSWYLSIFTLVLTFFSLFGVIRDYLLAKRRSFTVRRVLGASGWQIISMIGLSGMKILAISAVIGSVASSFLIHNWLSSYAYHVNESLLVPLITTTMLVISIWIMCFAAVRIYAGRIDLRLLGNE